MQKKTNVGPRMFLTSITIVIRGHSLINRDKNKYEISKTYL
jgi:hypothetical protein